WEKHCDPTAEINLASQAGVSIVIEDDDAYPPLLREIHDPPICLYVTGNLDVLKNSAGAIAIVGTRHTSFYGIRMAEMLAASAAQAGWPVVSGLARGIDTAAHEATLRAGGQTIAVIGSGLAYLYPKENTGLAIRIAEQNGAVISEFPMLYRPDRRSFPMRNRIISGITRGTIVVEAGIQSGSLITAAQAIDQNRNVYAVPGLADTPHARGCHALIKDGAKLIENFQDVIDDFNLLPLEQTTTSETAAAGNTKPPAPEIHLQGLELKIWRLVQNGEAYIDDIIAMADEETSSVLAAILTLELKRLVKQLPGKRIAPL
ncbi:MAG TPA: DNA-processing protein DprA, partial [Lentisphaeria bacterium]|nr:DNA-processing protein DprA [Lentisphaeria bacterium]